MATERLRIVASLIRTTGDWDLAEDAVADAAERALQRWALDGIPDRPAAWLTTTARRRAIDVLRRRETERTKLTELAMPDEPDPIGASEPIADDRLRLVFTCCHPALSMEARVALTLKVVSNLSTEAIGRVFLTSEATMGQRLLRAKQKIANAGIPYRVPPAEALAERLDGVLAVIYLVFTEAYATAPNDDVADEAIRLGRLLVELMPDAGEARGLLALMLLQHARRAARVVDGELVTLEDQDRSRWDTDAISEALALIADTGADRGPYRIQAELAGGARHSPRRCVDGLAAHRRPLRRVDGGPPVTGRRPQPCGGCGHERRPARRAVRVGRGRRRSPSLPARPGRPRRAARPRGTHDGGAGRTRSGDRAGDDRRAAPPAHPAARRSDYSVMPLISSAIFCDTSSLGIAVCIAISFIMSPWTVILPAMNACIPAAWSWSTKIFFAVS